MKSILKAILPVAVILLMVGSVYAEFDGFPGSIQIWQSKDKLRIRDAGSLTFGDSDDVTFTYDTTNSELDIVGDVNVSGGVTFTGAITLGDATGAVTFNSGTYNTGNSDDNMVDVGDIELDSISPDGTAITICATGDDDVSIGNSTGRVTITSDDVNVVLLDATDDVLDVYSSAGVRIINVDLGAADLITIGDATNNPGPGAAGTAIVAQGSVGAVASGQAGGAGGAAAFRGGAGGAAETTYDAAGGGNASLVGGVGGAAAAGGGNPGTAGTVSVTAGDGGAGSVADAGATGGLTSITGGAGGIGDTGPISGGTGGGVTITAGAGGAANGGTEGDGGDININSGNGATDGDMNIGTANTVAIVIGNDAASTLSIDTSDWDINATGDMSNIGSIGADGLVTITSVLIGLDIDGTSAGADANYMSQDIDFTQGVINAGAYLSRGNITGIRSDVTAIGSIDHVWANRSGASMAMTTDSETNQFYGTITSAAVSGAHTLTLHDGLVGFQSTVTVDSGVTDVTGGLVAAIFANSEPIGKNVSSPTYGIYSKVGGYTDFGHSIQVESNNVQAALRIQATDSAVLPIGIQLSTATGTITADIELQNGATIDNATNGVINIVGDGLQVRGALNYAGVSFSTDSNTYVLDATPNLVVSTPLVGQMITWTSDTAGDGASTISVDGVADALNDRAGNATTTGDVLENMPMSMIFGADGNWHLVGI